MKKILLTSSAIILCSYNISMAADMVYHNPEVPTYDEQTIWEGVYIGAQLGYDWARMRLDNNFDIKADSNGFIGGIYAGYNWEFSNAYLFGVEADINYTDLSSDSTFGNQTWHTRVQWEGAIRARFGVNYERVLPYIAGGVAFAGVQDDLDTHTNNSWSNTEIRTGFTIGAGVDYSLTNNLLLRAEYRYSDYGKRNIFTNTSETRLSTNSVRFGLAYKF